MTRKRSASSIRWPEEESITAIAVSGYKSIAAEQKIEIRPLTILAGANSSGKSSIIQPLLLLKQTLESTYDPGALLLDGPNVRFTSTDQFLSRIRGEQSNGFRVTIALGRSQTLAVRFSKQANRGLDIEEVMLTTEEGVVRLNQGMTHDEIRTAISPRSMQAFETLLNDPRVDLRWSIVRNRCFLEVAAQVKFDQRYVRVSAPPGLDIIPTTEIERGILRLIHVPGLRGNPQRTYPVTAVGPTFPGTFEAYVASVISLWETSGNQAKLDGLREAVETLGLTWKVTAKRLNDTQVELQVGRLTRASRGGARDLVSIADVGFGISQTLPVLAALLAAEPGQLVYLEQPEIHLHPRAQLAMARVLADAAKRGVRVIAETHSSLLLLGVQSLVAEGNLSPELIKLHWFSRCADTGETEVTSAELDEAGAFGDWSEDFAEVTLEAEGRYLDAAESRLVKT